MARMRNFFSLTAQITAYLTAAFNSGGLFSITGGPVSSVLNISLPAVLTPQTFTIPQDTEVLSITTYNDPSNVYNFGIFVGPLYVPTLLVDIVPVMNVDTFSNADPDLGAAYNNGVLGVGATLTQIGGPSQIVVNGVNLSIGQRVCISNQINLFENGIYDVTDDGAGLNPWQLTRSTDFDESADITCGSYFYANTGAVVIGQVSASNPVMGTDDITFGAYPSPSFFLPTIGTGLTTYTPAASGLLNPLPNAPGFQYLMAATDIFIFPVRLGGGSTGSFGTTPVDFLIKGV